MKWILALLFLPSLAFAQKGRLSDSNFATLSDLQARGASASALLNDTKIFVSANGINKQLSQAIIDKNIGGGGSGAGGINLLENPDFELTVTTGWVTSQTTVSQASYTIGTADNKKYAFVSSTAIGGYYESSAYQVTDVLNGQDCELNFNYQSVSGTWRADVFTSGTVIASQTLASATNWVAGPKIFYPCGNLASSTTKVRFTNLASGTIAIDDVYLGSIRSLKNGAIVTAWQPYTPITTGFGVIANSTLVWRQVGNAIQIKGSFQTGTVTATSGTISLPPGFVIKANEYSGFRHSFGQAWRLGGGTNTLTAGANNLNLAGVYNGSNGVIQFAYQTVAALYGNNNADALVASGDFINIEMFTITVEGTTGSNTTFDSRCPNDISCEDWFSAKVSAAGIVTDEDLDWISGNCAVATSTFTCNFNAGIFTTAPNCTVSPTPDSQVVPFQFTNTVSSVTYRTRTSAANADSAQAAQIFCKKTGVDRVGKKTIEGFLSKQMTTSGNGIARTTWVAFGGAGSTLAVPAVCNVSPCTIFKNEGPFTTVTRSTTGTYTANLAAGTFVDIQSISHSILTSAAGINRNCYFYSLGLTSIDIMCRNTSSGALEDTALSLEIKGYR